MTDVISVLEQARRYEIEISTQLEHIERLHRIAARARESTAYTQRIADKLYQLETELNAQIDKTVDAKLRALEYISLLDGEERGVIEHYYLLAENWYRIALKMYMSERSLYLLRKNALKKLNNFYAPETGRRNHGNRKSDKNASGAREYHTRGAGADDRRNSVSRG